MTTILITKDANRIYAAWDSKSRQVYETSNKLMIGERIDTDKVLRIGYGFLGIAGSSDLADYIFRKILLNKKSFVYSKESLKSEVLKEIEVYTKAYMEGFYVADDHKQDSLNGKKTTKRTISLLYADPFKFISLLTDQNGKVNDINHILAKDLPCNYACGAGTGADYAKAYYNKYNNINTNKDLVIHGALMVAIKSDIHSGYKISKDSLNVNEPELVRSYKFLKNFTGKNKNVLGWTVVYNTVKYEIINMIEFKRLKLVTKIESKVGSLYRKITSILTKRIELIQ